MLEVQNNAHSGISRRLVKVERKQYQVKWKPMQRKIRRNSRKIYFQIVEEEKTERNSPWKQRKWRLLSPSKPRRFSFFLLFFFTFRIRTPYLTKRIIITYSIDLLIQVNFTYSPLQLQISLFHNLIRKKDGAKQIATRVLILLRTIIVIRLQGLRGSEIEIIVISSFELSFLDNFFRQSSIRGWSNN